jgi:GT2 family glycosyltransferase
MKVAVIIASVGRPVELARWGEHCRRQTVTPSEIIFSTAQESDLPAGFDDPDVRVLRGPKGACHQRNLGLASLTSEPDLVAFFDDDYVPSRTCLEGMVQVFERYPDLAGASGRLLADGINTAGITFDVAREMVDAFDASGEDRPLNLHPIIGTYGCNMAFRHSMIQGLRFDERLPLYAWQEDIDFSRRLLKRGRVCRTDAFVGVHQGVKGGRTGGQRLGYSQIANPLYLIGKGTMPVHKALALMVRNVASNPAKALRPEAWVDRRGRVAGNWIAVRDLVTGKLKPERILDL